MIKRVSPEEVDETEGRNFDGGADSVSEKVCVGFYSSRNKQALTLCGLDEISPPPASVQTTGIHYETQTE